MLIKALGTKGHLHRSILKARQYRFPDHPVRKTHPHCGINLIIDSRYQNAFVACSNEDVQLADRFDSAARIVMDWMCILACIARTVALNERNLENQDSANQVLPVAPQAVSVVTCNP